MFLFLRTSFEDFKTEKKCHRVIEMYVLWIPGGSTSPYLHEKYWNWNLRVNVCKTGAGNDSVDSMNFNCLNFYIFCNTH